MNKEEFGTLEGSEEVTCLQLFTCIMDMRECHQQKNAEPLKSKAIRVTVPTPHGYKTFCWPRKVLIVAYGIADEYQALPAFAICV